MRRKIKLFGLVPFTIFILPLLLTSCGRDTMNWPTINLNLGDNVLESLEIKYFYKINGKNPIYEEETKITYNENSIKQNIMNVEGFPYKEKLEKAPTKDNFLFKIIVSIKGKNTFVEVIFINYGVSKGYVSFNENEWHFLPGDFSGLYYDFVT